MLGLESLRGVPAMPHSNVSPAHYKLDGVEVIDLAERLSFNRGNIVKYVARAGVKNQVTELEDLEKAQWYLSREIENAKLRQGARNATVRD